MKKAVIALSLITLLNGCALKQPPSTPDAEKETPPHSSWDGNSYEPKYPRNLLPDQPINYTQELSFIVRGLADQLIVNDLSIIPNNEPIAVTSFVNLDDLSTTNWLGQTLSESFIHELTIRRIPVIDYKTTGTISVTGQGDFVFTRDWKKLRNQLPVSRILTGTMSRNSEGVIVNMRVINMESGFVESTSQGIIPNHLVIGGSNSMGPLEGRGRYIYRTGSAPSVRITN